MSNPVATIDNTIATPDDPQVVRKTYTRIVYEEQDFFLYSDGEGVGTFDPSNMGQRTYMMQRLGFAGVLTQPSFVSDATWVSVQEAPSMFVTAVKSVMPKMIVPSQVLVDNGPITANKTYSGEYLQAGWTALFNWFGTYANADIPAATWNSVWYKYVYVGGVNGALYLTTRHKDDKTATNELRLELDQPPDPVAPVGPQDDPPTGEWAEDELVVKGAFVLLLNVVPTVSGIASTESVNKSPWKVTVECGDIKLAIGEAGALQATITSGDNNTVTGNLAEGKAKGGPPQQKHIVDKDPYVIWVYPVWNGIIVMSGGQDARGVVHTTSTFVPKWKEASIFVGYSNGFDPANPAEVEVGITGGVGNTNVDFGDKMLVTAENCRIDLAYLPCFFSRKAWFDEWFLEPDDDPGVVTYDFNVYPIWTKNGTSYQLGSVTVNSSGYAGPVADTTYRYVSWKLEYSADPSYQRYAGEIFGSVLEVVETRVSGIVNANGHFVLQWTGGANEGHPSDRDWKHFIQSIQVTMDVDGSNGSITVDKYGVAGQGATPTQCIGAITVAATGGYGTVGSVNPFFQGLAMGIADAAAAGSATWTIPLMGLEKKMEDMALINVPFFDGRTLDVTTEFLTKYAGIKRDMTAANPAVTLGISSDVNTPRFDWKTGTSVKSALEEVMQDTLHTYVVMDGKVFFFELDINTGLPVKPGPDRKGSYTDTTTVSRDKTPNFDNLRNQIVVMALQQVPEGKGTDIAEIPLFPMVESRTNTTVPVVPWARSIFQPATGALTQTQLSTFADRLASKTMTYYEIGSLQIPGNALIRPYDQWGGYIIKSVSHNLDFQAKSWTTSMELMRVAT